MGSLLPRPLLKVPMEYALATAAGLLSSSCCVIQLVLNSLSFGCAGFAVLTPYRPFFLSLTAVILAINIRKNGIGDPRTINSIIISATLAFSPEIVRLRNEGFSLAVLFNRTQEKETSQEEVVILQLHGLGCEACANNVLHYLETSVSGYNTSVQVFFEKKYAIIHIKNQEDARVITTDSLIEAVAKSGSKAKPFSATLVRREKHDIGSPIPEIDQMKAEWQAAEDSCPVDTSN